MKHSRWIILLLCATGALAQEMVTDRPDFTESALVVAKRTIQIESGTERVDFDIYSEWSRPSVMVRAGLGSNLELRLGFAGWTGITVHDRTQTYANDMMLEAKYQFTASDADVPLALLLVSTWPTGEPEVSVGQTEMGIKLAASRDLNDRAGISFNLGAISSNGDQGRTWSALASVSMGISLHDRTAAFVEVLADIPQKHAWQPVLDGGLTFLIRSDLQLDAYLGRGLNSHAADYIVGAGLSFRFGY